MTFPEGPLLHQSLSSLVKYGIYLIVIVCNYL